MKFSVTEIIFFCIIFFCDSCLIKKNKGEKYITNPQEHAFLSISLKLKPTEKFWVRKKKTCQHILSLQLDLLYTRANHLIQLKMECIRFIAYIYPETFHFILSYMNFMRKRQWKNNSLVNMIFQSINNILSSFKILSRF